MKGKKQSVLVLTLMMALSGVSGCSDEPAYREYRTEDGKVVREYIGGASQGQGGSSVLENMAGAAVGAAVGTHLANKLSDDSRDRDRDRDYSGGSSAYPYGVYSRTYGSGSAAGSGVTSSSTKNSFGTQSGNSESTTTRSMSSPSSMPKANITARGGTFSGMGTGS